jgi:hypothetical protein
VTDPISLDPRLLKAALSRTPDCATEEELARLCGADREGGADARIAEHVSGCVRCRTELALLQDFARGPRPDEEEAVAAIVARLAPQVGALTRGEPPARPARVAPAAAPRWAFAPFLRTAAAGLAVATATAVAVLTFTSRDGGPPALSPQSAVGPTVLRSTSVALVAPRGDLDAPARELTWQAVPGAASYEVEVTEVDRTEVWKSEVQVPRAALPQAVSARAVPGKPFVWRVVAKDAQGRAIATSEGQRFRVRLGERRTSEDR